jgi:polysaccharide export outer membrane protein
MRSIVTHVAALAVAIVASACGPHRDYAPYGNVETMADEQYNVSRLPPYAIQTGDRLSIEFARNPELDQEVMVRPDGMISLPFIDEVRAAGLTPDDVDQEIERRFKGELANPDATVVVLGLGGQLVFVDGEVTRPGMFPLTAGMTALAAISSAGGMTTRGIREQVILIRRDEEGKPVGHSVDLSDVVRGTASEGDVLLEPFDIVYIPRSKIANAGLWVDQYIREMLPIRLRVGFVLFL